MVMAEIDNGADLVKRMGAIWRGEVPGFGPRERMEAGKWLGERGFGRAPETVLSVNVDATADDLAVEVASDALADLAGLLTAGSDPVGGMVGGIVDVTPEKD